MIKFSSAQRPNRVTAVFERGRFCFEIARDATLAQLAEQLSRLGERHGGMPLSVDVRVAVEQLSRAEFLAPRSRWG